METIKNISLVLILSTCIVLILNYFQTTLLFKYLENNLLTLLLTLMAIITATLSLIASKMQDIIVIYKELDFSKPIKEMRITLIEQITLIVFSSILLSIYDSKIINFTNKEFAFRVALIFVFIYTIRILWDTGNSVFIIIEEIQEINKNKT